MAQIKFTNFGDSTLASGIAPGDTTITLATGTGALFPTLTGGDWFRAVIEDVTANKECIKVTARTGDILTVERAQEGTTARTFSVGSVVSLRLTVSSFDEYVAAVQSGDNTWTGAQRGTMTTDNDLSFDLSVTNNFVCTPTAGGALTFTNHTAGQSGFVLLVNGSNYAITAAATTKIAAADLTRISATGTYLLSYLDNGTNAYVVASAALS